MNIHTPADNEEKKLIDEIDRGEWIPVSSEKRMRLLELSKKAIIELKKNESNEYPTH